jgi:hypothetical protein
VSREQLIADWRRRLAAAEVTPFDSSPRAAWLAQVRIRLYRFLLSVYGAAAWRGSPQEHGAATPASVIFDASEVGGVAGKPPKSSGEIRGVLQSVANAQECSLSSGPLTAGLANESWVVVASLTRIYDLGACDALLQGHNLRSRLVRRGNETAIEVAARDRTDAFRLLSQYDFFRRRPRRITTRPVQHETLASRHLTLALIVLASLLLVLLIVAVFS